MFLKQFRYLNSQDVSSLSPFSAILTSLSRHGRVPNGVIILYLIIFLFFWRESW
jgi:hypothetical protein